MRDYNDNALEPGDFIKLLLGPKRMPSNLVGKVVGPADDERVKVRLLKLKGNDRRDYKLTSVLKVEPEDLI